MDASHHMAAAVMELDLTAYHPNLVDRINAVPGLKTSAAFFTFLRANLAIPLSEMSSNVSTPILEPILQEPSALQRSGYSSTDAAGAPAASGAAISLDDIPPLSLGVLASRADKVDALKLVADSIAQQRQTASRSLVFHPLNLAGLALALAVAYQTNPDRDFGLALTLASGVVMSYLVGIRYVTTPYLRLAEEIKYEWLEQGGSCSSSETAEAEKEGDNDDEAAPIKTEDTVIGARYGKEMIGALVLRLEPASASASAAADPSTSSATAPAAAAAPAARRKHSRGSNSNTTTTTTTNLRGGHGVIRAWTTKLRYRRRGVGGDLLNEAVRVTRERCGKDATVGFAQAHANSNLVLPAMYNSPFHAGERQATQALDRVLAQWDGKRRR